MSASSTLPSRLPPRTRSMSPDVTLNRSEKKVSGRVRASSVIGLSASRAVGVPILTCALRCPKLLDSKLPTDRFYPPEEGGVGGFRLPSSLKGLNNLVNAPDAVHERGARSEDVGAVDLVDLAPLDRGDPLPAGPPRDRLRIDRLAAPRGEDDLGIALDDDIGIDLAPGGGLLVDQIGEVVA